MKKHVKGRKESVVISLEDLTADAREPEGFIFNIIESRGSG
jgi:hypothetical protein